MRRAPVQILLLSLTLSLCGLGPIVADSEIYDQLLDQAGYSPQVEAFPGLLRTEIEQATQNGAAIPQEAYQIIIASIEKSIDPSVIMAAIRGDLAATISEEDLKPLLAWYESELGRTLVASEKKSSTPEGRRTLAENYQKLFEDRDRVDVAQRISTQLGSTERTLEFQGTTGLAIYSLLMTAMNPHQTVDLEAYQAQMDAMEADTIITVEHGIVAALVFSFQDISLNDLAQYEAFLNQEVTLQFNKTVLDSLYLQLGESIQHWATELASILAGPPGKDSTHPPTEDASPTNP